jgi:hypothetical protein
MGKKVVWVLGAGFSKPLGGPLLPRLLSPSSYEDLKLRFPAAGFNASQFLWALRLYHYGLRYQYGRLDRFDAKAVGESMWEDAEEYLDRLDAARSGGITEARHVAIMNRLTSLMSPGQTAPLPSAADLAVAARRLVGAECAGFLQKADTTTEIWEPFKDWANELGVDDTVITFNYDRAIDLIASNHVMVVTTDGDAHIFQSAKCCPVLKLHGSVDWQREASARACRFIRTADPDFCVTCLPEQLAIATPGPTKKATAAELSLQWNLALTRLTEADAVVFVGYRFPPSDAEARTKLLGALLANTSAHLALHIVLGPRLGSDDNARLAGLLSATCRRAKRQPVGHASKTYDVVQHPMYSQDFFSVWHRSQL